MVIIEIIKLFEDINVYSIITIRYDSQRIIQSARLEFSKKAANRYVGKKQKAFEKTGRKVFVKWYKNNFEKTEVEKNAL